MITRENIFDEIAKGNYLEILKSDLVDKVKDKYDCTPLHRLAWDGVKKVFDHPSVDKVKNKYGDTPLYVLAHKNCLTKEDLRKKYPWYKKEIRSVYKAVEEIVNTPTSIRFILED